MTKYNCSHISCIVKKNVYCVRYSREKERYRHFAFWYKYMTYDLVYNLFLLDDGDEDVVVATNYGRAVFYENDGGSMQNWLRIRVVNR